MSCPLSTHPRQSIRTRSLRTAGFTLIELLVVMLIMGLLMAVLIPAVNSARESARATQSKNNLKQIALAMQIFNSSKGFYPPSWLAPSASTGNNVDGWSMLTLLLPYLEQKAVYGEIDYTKNYNFYVSGDSTTVPATPAPLFQTADGQLSKLGALRIPTYLSPAEPRDEVREGNHYPFNYAVNLGTWFIWDPVTGQGGNGSAYPNSHLTDSAFQDGLSSTLAFAEVKAWQPYFRNSARTAADLGSVPPATPAALAGLLGSPESLKLTGHTEWLDGKAHHVGFTTVFRPNQKVLMANADNSINTTATGTIDCDWNNWQEGKDRNLATPSTTPTYAAITVRSYFANVVNVAMMDGSVRPVEDQINIGVWRAISTRAGNEKLPNNFSQR